MNRYEMARYNAGLTQTDAAAKAGVSRNTIEKLERGFTVRPTAPVAQKLAEVYGMTVAELLELPADDRKAA